MDVDDATANTPLAADARNPSSEFLTAFARWEPILDGYELDDDDVLEAVHTLRDMVARDSVALRLHPASLREDWRADLPEWSELVGLDNSHDQHVHVLGGLAQREWESDLASTLHTLHALALLNTASEDSDDPQVFYGSATPEVLTALRYAQAADPTAQLPAMIATSIALAPPVRRGGQD